MQVTITAEWRTYETYDPTHSDKEITVAGLSGAVYSEGDGTWGWEVSEADADWPLARGNSPTIDGAVVKVEDAIRAALEGGKPE